MDKILALYRAPRHRGHLSQPTHQADIRGKICGDRLLFELLVEQDRVRLASFSGACCAVTTALADSLIDRIQDLPLAKAQNVSTEQLLAALEVKLPPGRWECADLPRKAFLAALGKV